MMSAPSSTAVHAISTEPPGASNCAMSGSPEVTLARTFEIVAVAQAFPRQRAKESYLRRIVRRRLAGKGLVQHIAVNPAHIADVILAFSLALHVEGVEPNLHQRGGVFHHAQILAGQRHAPGILERPVGAAAVVAA